MQSKPVMSDPPGAFELTVIEGPDAGRVYTVGAERSSVLVGSSAVCGLRLTEHDSAARQCSFELRGDRLCLLDLSPEKTTRVNGVLAREAYLVGGEVIRIGATAIAVGRAGSACGVIHTVTAQARSFGRIQGESPAMLALYPLFAIYADRRDLLVIEGERGAGKRLLAEELHARGAPKGPACPVPTSTWGPFVVLPRQDPGSLARRLASAHGGTLYVEEGASLDRDALLVLASSTEARVIIATRGEVSLPVELRERIVLPALRDREGDVAALARSFWAALGGADRRDLPDDFVARFEEHLWPGNVRELRMAVYDRFRHGAEALDSDIHEIIEGANRPRVSPDALARVLECDLPFAEARAAIIAELERRYVDRALERANDNVSRAAANSGIAHRYFQVLKSRRKTA